MQNVIVDYRSEPLYVALQTPSQASVFASLVPMFLAPSAVYSDGVYTAGHNAQVAPGRVLVFPVCDGAAGAQFSTRVYGWRPIGNPDENPNNVVWFPYLLAELLATAAALTAPIEAIPSLRALSGNQTLCDTLSLTQGQLGNGGLLNSTGPGTNLTAYALIDLCGCRFYSFDFQQQDAVSMNAFHARA